MIEAPSGMVETVRGPVDTNDLGMTLMHEHIFIKNPELEETLPDCEWSEEEMFTRAVDALGGLADKGIGTIVDVTVPGLGRSIGRIARVALASSINIVVATGYYSYRDLPAYFSVYGPGRISEVVDPLITLFLRDIQEGISGTQVKAGIIKIASDQWGITTDVARVFEAAAVAHLETRVPITTHSNPSSHGGLEQQRFLRDRGVDIANVVIGHSGDSADIPYLRTLMDDGSTIGFDRFGMEIAASDEQRIDVLCELIEHGYEDRIILSHDASIYSVNLQPSLRDRIMPDWHHRGVTERVIPELSRRGVPETTILSMMRDNPARILGRNQSRR